MRYEVRGGYLLFRSDRFGQVERIRVNPRRLTDLCVAYDAIRFRRPPDMNQETWDILKALYPHAVPRINYLMQDMARKILLESVKPPPVPADPNDLPF